jgi:hypothetical protein
MSKPSDFPTGVDTALISRQKRGLQRSRYAAARSRTIQNTPYLVANRSRLQQTHEVIAMPPKLESPTQPSASRRTVEQRLMAQDVLSMPSPPAQAPATSATPDAAAEAEEIQTRPSTLDTSRDSPSISNGNPSVLRKGPGLTLSEATQRVKPAGLRARLMRI